LWNGSLATLQNSDAIGLFYRLIAVTVCHVSLGMEHINRSKF
jgi:hypothetical protein